MGISTADSTPKIFTPPIVDGNKAGFGISSYTRIVNEQTIKWVTLCSLGPANPQGTVNPKYVDGRNCVLLFPQYP